MTDLYDRVAAAAEFVRDRIDPSLARPRAWIILGSGLGDFTEDIADATRVRYEDIPHFPHSTAPGHAGELVLGRVHDLPVAVMAGRVHFYEGYSLEEVTFPVRVAKALGTDTLIVTSAVGGMNPHHRRGDLLAIDDHINLMGDSPLRGPNDERLGPRFPDMSAPYDPALVEEAERSARARNVRLHRAVLVAVPGPQLETRAEYRFLRRIGADAVGMSSVPEAITAVHAGLRTVALSVVTDLCLPDALAPVDVEEILAVAAEASPSLRSILDDLIRFLGTER